MSCRDLHKAARNVLNAWDHYGTAECLRGWIDVMRSALAEAPPAPGCIDSLCPCQDGALCHYVDGPDGTMALPALSAGQYPLPDDMYDSKDWRAGSYAERVEWLHTMYEASQKTLDTYLAMRPSAEPSEPVAWRYKSTIGSPWSLSDDGYYISCKRTQGYIVESLGVIDPTAPAEPTAACVEPTVPAASVNWLLTQCDEYQRRAHDAEREVLALRAQIGGGR
jgi:hypothetical protein